MEDSRFTLLLREAAQRVTRRESLGVLAGGALVLTGQGAATATDKAKRRKKRKKRQNSSSPRWKDVSFWVNNRAGSSPASGVYGYWDPGAAGQPGGCSRGTSFTLNPGDAQRYFADYFLGYVWINGAYFFNFENKLFQRPTVTAAYGGRSPLLPATNCPSPVGTEVIRQAPMDVGTVRSITLNGHVFTVKRYGDTSSNKIFEIIVPAGI